MYKMDEAISCKSIMQAKAERESKEGAKRSKDTSGLSLQEIDLAVACRAVQAMCRQCPAVPVPCSSCYRV